MDTFALTAWVAQIITRANKISDLGTFQKGSVNADFMREALRLSNLANGPFAVRDFLKKHGIPLIVEPHLPSTYLDGAAILVDPDRPVIGMTLRYDRLDYFWFTLMHELAHVALHWKERTDFIDDLDIEAKDDPKEKEADHLAGEVLIPKSVWLTSAASRIPSPEAAQSLAKKLGIHPAIVAGKMRHERKAFRLLNNLIGHREVRKQFKDTKWTD
jgi:HTH-type transcriptional regulator/antitoxin HigA